jgi:hypothetical protein
MFNSISNLSRKSNKYGDLHFLSFYSSILSRLAYFNDNQFLTKYSAIFGPVINDKILTSIDNVNSEHLDDLLDDQTLFGLTKGPQDLFKDYEYQYQGKNYIDFIKLAMPQNINNINGETKGTPPVLPIPGQPPISGSVQYISLGWSNYGEVYIVADKRMPHTLFVIFRGTYSAKTAALYSKPTSIVPLSACKNSPDSDSFLYGIFKTNVELLHTTMEAMSYLATNFLGATQPNSIKVFTTGHSLGGALCSNFAYLWMSIKETAPYNAAPYNVLSNNIICISLGAPRCMSSSVSTKFCNYVQQKKILFLRITSRGDPVPGLPPKTGFQHPCSLDPKMRSVISEDCNALLTMRPTPNVNYQGDLDCLNYKARAYVPNALSHTIYLDILFTSAVDILNFIKGVGVSKEVLRTNTGSTVCRVIVGSSNNYKAAFFDVNNARETPSNIDLKEEKVLEQPSTNIIDLNNIQPSSPASVIGGAPSFKIGGSVPEDIRMTPEAFQLLVQGMTPLTLGNLSPQSGTMVNPFNNKTMPELACSIKTGGKKYTRKMKKGKNGKRKITKKPKKSFKKSRKSRKNH